MKMPALTSVPGFLLGGDSPRREGWPGPKLPMQRQPPHRFWMLGCRVLSQGLPPCCWWTPARGCPCSSFPKQIWSLGEGQWWGGALSCIPASQGGDQRLQTPRISEGPRARLRSDRGARKGGNERE